MNKAKQRLVTTKTLLLGLVFGLLLNGCGSLQMTGGSKSEPTPTVISSDTPVPTSTATATLIPTDTPVPTPTVTRTATPDSRATLAAAQTATQAAIDNRVNAELVEYGIDPSLGQVVWAYEDAVELDGGGYATGFYQKIEDLGVLEDFVVQSEITWNTSGALAGCGFIFRAPDDWDLDIGDWYEFYMLRVQYAPVWFLDYWKDGRWEYSMPGWSGVESGNIEDENDSKNILTLDVVGDTFTVYINGVKERAVQNDKVTEGCLAFQVVQNSGTSYCKFENTWVWAYNK